MKIPKGTYVSIIVNVDYIFTCKASDIDEKLLDRRIKFINAGCSYSERNYEMTPTINIYCE